MYLHFCLFVCTQDVVVVVVVVPIQIDRNDDDVDDESSTAATGSCVCVFFSLVANRGWRVRGNIDRSLNYDTTSLKRLVVPESSKNVQVCTYLYSTVKKSDRESRPHRRAAPRSRTLSLSPLYTNRRTSLVLFVSLCTLLFHVLLNTFCTSPFRFN